MQSREVSEKSHIINLYNICSASTLYYKEDRNLSHSFSKRKDGFLNSRFRANILIHSREALKQD